MIERRKPTKAARKLYRRATAAAMLDTSVTMMKKLEAAGKLTPVRLGSRDVFYKAEQVEALAAGDATE
jgi:hypothetical protein